MKKENGFTLVEILIAVAIFATFIVVTTGALANVLRTERRISVLRSTQETCRYIIEAISREARNANGELDSGGSRIKQAFVMEGDKLVITYTNIDPQNAKNITVTTNTYSSNDSVLSKIAVTKKTIDGIPSVSDESYALNDKNEIKIDKAEGAGALFSLEPNPTDLFLPPKLLINIQCQNTNNANVLGSDKVSPTIIQTAVSPRGY